MLPKKVKGHFFGLQIFLFAQGLTARKFEGNEKFFRGGKLRSRIFLLAAYTPPLRIVMIAYLTFIFLTGKLSYITLLMVRIPTG